VAASAVCAITLAGLVWDGRQWLSRSSAGVRLPRQLVPAAAATAVAALDRQPVVWIAMLAVVSVCAVSAAFTHSPTPAPRTITPQPEELSR
jgi:hypothetical protein